MTFSPVQNMQAYAINDSGSIAGSASGKGFIRNARGVNIVGRPVGMFTTTIYSINNGGTVAGSLFSPTLVVGFTRAPGKSIETFEINGASYTFVGAINSKNSSTGVYTISEGGLARSFVRNADGSVVLIDCPGFSETISSGITESGEVAGSTNNGNYPQGS